MNSEKVKEIKKALKYCSEGKCEKCLIGKKDIRKCVDILLKDTLILINELESENERLRKDNELLRNAKVVYESVDYCYEDLKKAEKRIAELEKENAKLKSTNTNILKGCDEYKNRHLKQFAERLKEKFYYVFGNEYEQSVSGFDTKVLIEHIDETLKEFINE